MVTICRRGLRPTRFRPSGAEVYQISNLDLRPKRYPRPDSHTVGPLGRPTRCLAGGGCLAGIREDAASPKGSGWRTRVHAAVHAEIKREPAA
jgi:hypothetical protein